MRADVRALVTLYALVDIPHGNDCRGSAFLVFGRACRNCSVRADRRYGKFVAFLRVAYRDEVGEVLVFGRFFGYGCDSARSGFRPACGNFDLAKFGDSHIDGVAVCFDYFGTFFAVSLFDGFFHISFGFGVRDNVRDLEERRLKNHVLALGTARFLCGGERVYYVHSDMLLCKQLFHGCGKLGFEILRRPLAVEQESAAVLDRGDHVVHGDVRGLVTCDEIGFVDEIF